MLTKKIVIDTARERGQLFRVDEYSGKFSVYDVSVGPILNQKRLIGEARSMEDAIEVIKANVDGPVLKIRIT